MNTTIKEANIDFSKNPYRGILTEVARELGITTQSVWKSYNCGNYTVVKLVLRHVQQRQNVFNQLRNIPTIDL